MADILVEVIGWAGAALLLAAYYLISAKRLHGRSKTYHLMNLLGGAFIAFNSFANSALPSTALNSVWSSIAVYGLYKSLSPRG
jgi:hypothetical protein